MKKIVATVVAAGVMSMAPITPVQANVNTDSVHCVDNYEWWHAPFHASRAEVEEFFETTGLGVQLDDGDDGKTTLLWSYRWCGKKPKGVTERYVQTKYEPGDGLVAVTRATIKDGLYRSDQHWTSNRATMPKEES